MMNPGIVWTLLNLPDSLATFVESADPGRNEELSFFWTSASLPWNEPPARPTRKNTAARAASTHTVLGRRARGGLVLPGTTSVLLIHISLTGSPHGTEQCRQLPIGFIPEGNPET